MENNDLIPKKQNIFRRILNFIKNIFVKDIKLLGEPTKENEPKVPVESTNTDEKTNIIHKKTYTNIETEDLYERFIESGYIFKKQKFIEDISPELDKQRFFKLYENVRTGKISINQLNAIDLIRVSEMLNREVNIKLAAVNEKS